MVKSSHAMFERNAIQAVSKWKYQPQMQAGKPAEAPGQQVVAALRDEGVERDARIARDSLVAPRAARRARRRAPSARRRRRRKSKTHRHRPARSPRSCSRPTSCSQNDKYDECARDRRRARASAAGSEPPEIAQIHRFRGYICVNKGKSEQAAAEFEKSLGAAGARPRGRAGDDLLARADLHAARQVRPRARADRHLVRRASESPKPDAYYLKAMILVQQEKFRAARRAGEARRSSSARSRRRAGSQLLVVIYSQLKDYPNVADDARAADRDLARQEAVLGAARGGAELPGARGEGARDDAARVRSGAAEAKTRSCASSRACSSCASCRSSARR